MRSNFQAQLRHSIYLKVRRTQHVLVFKTLVKSVTSNNIILDIYMFQFSFNFPWMSLLGKEQKFWTKHVFIRIRHPDGFVVVSVSDCEDDYKCSGNLIEDYYRLCETYDITTPPPIMTRDEQGNLRPPIINLSSLNQLPMPGGISNFTVSNSHHR